MCKNTTEVELIATTQQATQPISAKAQTLFALGVMGYQSLDTPGACHATSSFDKMLALAKRRGFTDSKQLKGAARRGRATAFAMGKAQALATLVTDAEVQHELFLLTAWSNLRCR